jgi:hypothetical protein
VLTRLTIVNASRSFEPTCMRDAQTGAPAAVRRWCAAKQTAYIPKRMTMRFTRTRCAGASAFTIAAVTMTAAKSPPAQMRSDPIATP